MDSKEKYHKNITEEIYTPSDLNYGAEHICVEAECMKYGAFLDAAVLGRMNKWHLVGS